MPWSDSSERARSWMRLLASSITRTSASAREPLGRSSSKERTAISEATSPAWAPPMPSATTNRGARTKKLSSLPCRWRPRSEAYHCSAMRNMGAWLTLEGELGVADADAVAHVERLRTAQRLPVEVRPVGRAQILEHHHVPLRREPGVRRRGEGVLELDVALLAPAEHRAVREVVGHAVAQPGGRLDPQARGAVVAVAAETRRGDVHPRGVLVRRRARGARPPPAAPAAAEVPQSRARHPQQEQVEDGDEAELQRDGDGVERHARSSSKTTSEVPSVIVSPPRSDCAPWMRRPLTLTPLVEPRSRTVQEAPEGRSSACLRETLGSSTWMSASRERPSTAPLEGTGHVLPSTRTRARARRGSGSRSGSEIRSEVE